MVLITENILFDLAAIFSTIIVSAILIFKWRFTYWNNMGFPTLNPQIPFGDAKKSLLGKCTLGEQFREFYKTFKSRGFKHGGVYVGPKLFYVPNDPDIIKHIMQTDFSHFMNHGNYYDEEADPLSGHLFNLEDAKWRNMRVKLTPTFTSGKMKMMFHTLVDCTVGLKDIMDESAVNRTGVDIKDILGRFTTDVVGSVGFGLECNSLKDPNAEFRKYGKKVIEVDFWEKIKIALLMTVPHAILHAIRFKFTKTDVEKFFMDAIRKTVDYREKNDFYRKDFMHLLLQLKNRGTVMEDDKIKDDHGKTQEIALNMNELSAQAFVFFTAGFETSSTTMTFALYELALNLDVQEKLREEINSVLEKHDGKLTYDGVMEMTYMDRVLFETLRKYPPVPLLLRKCNKEYTIPNTTLRLEEGVDVGIPVLAIHTDPEYYPNPEKFDPERFTEENKSTRPHFTWLPFGEGPRLCIGLRFGLLQSKVGLVTLLKNYKIKMNKRTTVPLKLDPTSFISAADGGVWLDVEKLD